MVPCPLESRAPAACCGDAAPWPTSAAYPVQIGSEERSRSKTCIPWSSRRPSVLAPRCAGKLRGKAAAAPPAPPERGKEKVPELREPQEGRPEIGRFLGAEVSPEVMFPMHTGSLKIFEDYEFLGDVGSGCFGRVMLVKQRRSGHLRACKAVAIRSASERNLVDTEINILRSLNHPNILQMCEVYFDGCGQMHLVTELCEGGDLLFRIAYHSHTLAEPMKEGQVAYIMQQILSATRYCHRRGIVHRDLKPANILFVDRTGRSPLKIIDFGLASFTETLRDSAREVEVPQGGARGRLARMLPAVGGRQLIPRLVLKQVMQRAGTLHYMAPEMVAGGSYDEKADNFSIGIIFCEMLTGWHPFFDPQVDNTDSVHKKLMEPRPVELPPGLSEAVSPEARELCRGLLERNPGRRLTAGQALAHPWFRDPSKPSPFGRAEGLDAELFDGLVQYKAHNKLKRMVLQLLACELPSSEAHVIWEKFMALDAAGDGSLSPEELAQGMEHIGYKLGETELDMIVAALDCTGGQRVGYKEFVSALMGPVAFNREQLWTCFRKFDTVGRGLIGYEDVQAVLIGGAGASTRLTEAEWQDIAASVGAIDPNLPTELTFEAFVTLMSNSVNSA
mmetsp:Transcript_47720/g.103840  ORF Transcript_47720/g.103840 Transcript_47720/m.103840 type:complete len:618 (+) Transcript_47720:52-1905(+)